MPLTPKALWGQNMSSVRGDTSRCRRVSADGSRTKGKLLTPQWNRSIKKNYSPFQPLSLCSRTRVCSSVWNRNDVRRFFYCDVFTVLVFLSRTSFSLLKHRSKHIFPVVLRNRIIMTCWRCPPQILRMKLGLFITRITGLWKQWFAVANVAQDACGIFK